MTRYRILAAALATLAIAAPAASASPYSPAAEAQTSDEQTQDFRSADAIDSAVQAEKRDRDSAAAAELRARGRDGVQTGSLAGTTDATTRAFEQERAYSTYGDPAPLKPAPAPVTVDDDGPPWVLIGAGFAGIALLLGAAVLLVARPRRVRVAA
jgi:hypothetical protein